MLFLLALNIIWLFIDPLFFFVSSFITIFFFFQRKKMNIWNVLFYFVFIRATLFFLSPFIFLLFNPQILFFDQSSRIVFFRDLILFSLERCKRLPCLSNLSGEVFSFHQGPSAPRLTPLDDESWFLFYSFRIKLIRSCLYEHYTTLPGLN